MVNNCEMVFFLQVSIMADGKPWLITTINTDTDSW